MADNLPIIDGTNTARQMAVNIDGDGYYVMKHVLVDATTDTPCSVTSRGSIATEEQDVYNEVVNLYMQKEDVTPTITVNTAIGDTTLTIDDNTGLVDGDAISLREGTRVYQSVIVSSTTTEVVLASPLDFAFTTSALVVAGAWQMNVLGTQASPIEFCIQPPAGVTFDIQTINISLTDNAVMTTTGFGGISALSYGIVLKTEDGTIKNHFVIVNNMGFDEYGYTVLYDDKAPTDNYRLRARKNIREVNGTIIRLDGTTGDKLCLLVQDDLSGLTGMSVTINGHVVED